jgi:hypothetical protein
MFSAGIASAAPTKSPNAEIIPVTCDHGVTFNVVSNGNGTFTPGHILDGDGNVVIPVSFVFEGYDSGGTLIFSEHLAKQGQRKGQADRMITCTFGGTFEEGGETFTFVGTVTGFIAPR